MAQVNVDTKSLLKSTQRIASRGPLSRRRSSFPPAVTQGADSLQLDIFASLGLPELASMWTPVGWDTLLNFEGDEGMSRVKSEPGRDRLAKPAASDLAWKTILASQVEVQGVGQVGVARVLQEVWRRGGGEQGLWPSIIISLSLPETQAPGFRLPSPSPNAALALQNLYNLTLRHWEPSIFTGLLSSFGSPALRGEMDLPAMLGAAAEAEQAPIASGSGERIFGVATPSKELDMSQWSKLTPGGGADWNFLNVEDGVQGLDELLAQMQEGEEAREVAAIQSQIRKRPADEALFQMPTPETDASDSTVLSGRAGTSLVTPPSSHGSPLRAPGGQSAIARFRNNQLPTPAPSSSSLPRVKNVMQLAMPIASFVPPPPMCMFFSPVFHDLQNGKVGIWKGDLEVRGKGGGKFSVLIVGEASTGHMWQSSTWPTSVVYPPEGSQDTSMTATMIPVSHLAREGFTPAAMGMVLCNDDNIGAYVQMVQGLHAEGVAFHLSTPSRLPIVFLPAKFDTNDPLQRLGVAFMTKPGMALPRAAPLEEPAKKRRRQSAPAGTLPPLKATKHKKRESVASGMRGLAIPEETAEEKG